MTFPKCPSNQNSFFVNVRKNKCWVVKFSNSGTLLVRSLCSVPGSSDLLCHNCQMDRNRPRNYGERSPQKPHHKYIEQSCLKISPKPSSPHLLLVSSLVPSSRTSPEPLPSSGTLYLNLSGYLLLWPPFR